MVPLIVAGLVGTGSFFLLGLLKPTALVTAPFIPPPVAPPAPSPAPAGFQNDPNDPGNPGVLPLDEDGFPSQATRQFIQDNNLQERRFGPIAEQSNDRVVPVSQTQTTSAQVPSGPAQDDNLSLDPGSGLNKDRNLGGETTEPQSFFDSLNPFGD